jgi:hypothetical protein
MSLLTLAATRMLGESHQDPEAGGSPDEESARNRSQIIANSFLSSNTGWVGRPLESMSGDQ